MIPFLLACSPDPNAPPKVAYDHVACEHCAMLVSEPAYAAVLVSRENKFYYFDDPGCLFMYMMDKHPATSRLWFHSASGWLRESEVAFTTGAQTPMGSGLTAVVAGTPGALSVGEASSLVVSKQ